MTIPHHTARLRSRTPLGWVTITRSERGLSGLWFDGQKHYPDELDAVPVASDDALLQRAAAALAGYFRGEALPPALLAELDPQGTPFQQEVWRTLLAIGPGEVDSYGALAKRIGRPRAVRALGAAVGRNPISILIPCHRVLGASGDLTGYAGGLDRKKALLALEGKETTGISEAPAPARRP
ncbi:methylated-DNA--[protein]-cysteine S-methyltransferase [Pelomonas sp. KK5]|uniref:methylated-DNA--[protein]-cysteine S-methyltransferase n=1 Tax=Pelomonas sp. KK5 TaxID=1855730 RepID=UPI00097CA895|nr:methylated-DNA--[protein]-cysteine S-methyltransferase [Pelomonas sp. KK5]